MNRKRRIKQAGFGIWILSVCVCAGCAANPDAKYTREELDNLARIELYSAGSEDAAKVIEDADALYRFHQVAFDEVEEPFEEQQEELEEAVEEAVEEYRFVTYKYPVSRFGSKEPEEDMSITVYENSDIVKMSVSQGRIKGASIPQEYLTFYYEISDEDMEFFLSLAED